MLIVPIGLILYVVGIFQGFTHGVYRFLYLTQGWLSIVLADMVQDMVVALPKRTNAIHPYIFLFDEYARWSDGRYYVSITGVGYHLELLFDHYYSSIIILINGFVSAICLITTCLITVATFSFSFIILLIMLASIEPCAINT